MRSPWLGAVCATFLLSSGCFFGELGERPTLDPKYLDAGGAEVIEATDAGGITPPEILDAGTPTGNTPNDA